jgi:cytochrome d ubiquinol oxidase subunit II
VVAGWALAQRPELLPGLTVRQAAASEPVLVALLVAMALGAIVLVPSLALLFTLVLRGRFDVRPDEPGTMAAVGEQPEPLTPAREADGGRARLGGAAVGLAFVGAAVTFLSDDGLPLAIGVVLLLAGLVAVCAVVLPAVARQ